MYSVVSRLLDYSLRNNSPTLKLHDIELRVLREDMKSLFLDVNLSNVSYNFTFQNNGWISVVENVEGMQTERFSMGFYKDDHNFTYSGDRDFCLEVCEHLIDIIKSGFNYI